MAADKSQHKRLVSFAAERLKRRHAVVITEMVTYNLEIPDAIGFNHVSSTVIECKTSIQDFRADAKKYARLTPERRMGVYRFYLTFRGIISVEDLHKMAPGWGLLELWRDRVKMLVNSVAFNRNSQAENRVLISAIRRVGKTKGISVKYYTIETKNTATMAVLQEGAL